MNSKQPLVSVLVHTKNSQATLVQHLESIKNQSYKNIEIIVVDNHSDDATLSIARSYTSAIYTHGPERSAQRNFAARKAKGKYYLVPDSDMVLTRDVIRDCVCEISKHANMKAVIIPEKSEGIGYWAKCKALERECYVGDDSIEAARFFEHEAFWQAGGYDETITGPEDWDLPQKIKKKWDIGRISSHIIHLEGRVTLGKLAAKKFYYGRKVAPYIRQHPVATTAGQVIYLLRPAFYKNWRKLMRKPQYFFGMIIILMVEQVAGFIGFLAGQ